MSVRRELWIAGRATLTTVPSMNVILDPRIVAASIHGAADRGHGESAARVRITASSQGGLAAVDKSISLKLGYRNSDHLSVTPELP
jgi:hypothetical protein